MNVAVIGAGPAGMTAAYELAKAGVHVTLFEASPRVGGMARTFELWGQKVDLGPHRFFSSDARVNRLWLELIGSDYAMVNRLTRIFYKGKFFHYPLKAFNALENLGLLEAARCVASYGAERVSPTRQDGSFEDWVVSRFGRRLFEIFFKTYSEKLWGITCKELDADFAAQRIKKLSLFEAVKNAVLGGKGNTHKTLVDQFAYPKGGTGEVYERMAEAVRQRGGRVELKAPVKRVLVEGGRASGVELVDGRVERFDHVVSSMPLTQLVDRIDEAPAQARAAAKQLTFRNTILVYLKVDAPELFPDNWLYVHSKELRMGRLTNFRNWVPELYGSERSTIVALEYWCYDQDALWSAKDEELVALATEEFRATGLSKGSPVLAGHVERVPRCYPVYRRGYKDALAPVEAYLRTVQGLTVVGRYGAFKYNNQDHSILMGMLAAENIARGARHDLWTINTDYENYQEEAVITSTGLAVKGEAPEGAQARPAA
jgi:protoporphyrinogen oxidase